MIELKSLRPASKDEFINELNKKWGVYGDPTGMSAWVFGRSDCYVTRDGLFFIMTKKGKRKKDCFDDFEKFFLKSDYNESNFNFFWQKYDENNNNFVTLNFWHWRNGSDGDHWTKRILTKEEVEDIKNLYFERFEAENCC